MSGFLEKFNMDDVYLRNLIIGLLRSLNEKVTYFQVNDQQEKIEVYVPFFFSLTGDESFLMDSFVEYENCIDNLPHAEGNYDILPRGVVSYQSSDIDAQALTNKYVRMSYAVEDVKGEMKTLSSHTNSIPLNLSFGIAMKIDTLLDAFKIYQNVIRTFYKTYSYSFEFEGMRIPVTVGFPESYELTKQYEFTYASQEYITFNFSVALETYFPDKDLSTERFRGNLMQAGLKAKQVISKNTNPPNKREIL
jgi:hypothetical protein